MAYLIYESKPRALWVDAISINQADVDACNSQARSVSRIYSSGTRAITWFEIEETTLNLVQYMKFAKKLVKMACSEKFGKHDMERVFISDENITWLAASVQHSLFF